MSLFKKGLIGAVIAATALIGSYTASAHASQFAVGINGEQNLKTTSVFLKGLFGKDKEALKPQAPEVDLSAKFEDTSEDVERNLFKTNPVILKYKRTTEWEEVTSQASGLSTIEQSNILQPLEVYRGPIVVGSGRPLFRIEYITIDHEILAEHWLAKYIFEQSFTIEKPIDAISEQEARAQLGYLKNNFSYQAQVRAIIVNDRVFIITAEYPAFAKEEIKSTAIQMLDSVVIDATVDTSIEEFEQMSLPNRFSFQYPASWVPKSETFTDATEFNYEIYNYSTSGEIDGVVIIKAYRRQDEQALDFQIEKFRSHILNERKIEIEKLMTSTPIVSTSEQNIAHLEQYSVKLENDAKYNLELWVASYISDGWTNFVYMITPKQERYSYAWARNTRMFELLLDSTF